MGVKRRKNPDDSLRSLLRTTQQDPTAQNLTKLAFAAKRENQAVVFKFNYDTWIYRLLPHKKIVSVWGGQPRTNNDWHELVGGREIGAWLRRKLKYSKYRPGSSTTIDEVILIPNEVEKHMVMLPTSNVLQDRAGFVDYILPHEAYQLFSRKRTNPDEDLRRSFRRAKQTGTAEDKIKALIDRLRNGQVDMHRIANAASLDHAGLRADSDQRVAEIVVPNWRDTGAVWTSEIKVKAELLNKQELNELSKFITKRFQASEYALGLSKHSRNELNKLRGKAAKAGLWYEILRMRENYANDYLTGPRYHLMADAALGEVYGLQDKLASLLLWGV